MITADQAMTIARQALAAWNSDELEVVIREEMTESHPVGWVFFYNSRRFLDTGDCNQALAGNVPLIVTRQEGKFFFTGPHHEIAYYIRNLELTGNPHREPEWSILVHAADKERRLRVVHYLWTMLGFSLMDASTVTSRVLEHGEAVGILARDEESARRAEAALTDLGVSCEAVGA